MFGRATIRLGIGPHSSPKYLRNGFEYSDQTLREDRYYGGTGGGSQEFMTFRIDAA